MDMSELMLPYGQEGDDKQNSEIKNSQRIECGKLW